MLQRGFRRIHVIVLLVITTLLSGSSSPARAQTVDLAMLMLLAGPVSEAVQETVLLIRRGDKFISSDSLVVGCVAGASAGAAVGIAPALGFTMTGVAMPVSLTYIFGATLLSCGMALAGGVVGMATAWGLDVWRQH
ncbi:hypothetical protein CCP2SC5_180031 [Azospirillaceae bacterium]